ncbi:hypothetical protein [Arthrobacter sp. H35-D1]|uniref:hypothetical protein n=1 Tax=Arthrobacter sp. H35-D1 TaxID=3046202 RepID=UPI0024BB447C|nr:hypothetical protein [Arthrobacter sp. H35-D1]MDJ0311815.1 hypothetical protein [Arthrobacter sp. H35-D1]
MNVTSVLSRQITRSPGAVRARRSGLVTMAVFTGAWSMLGLASGVLALQIAAWVLIVAAVYFFIRSTRAGAPSPAGKTDPAPSNSARLSAPSDSRFVVAVIAETVAIVATVFILLTLHLPQYVVPLVAVIVGAHFFIFIRPGDRTVHVIAGSAGVAVGLAGIALIAQGRLDPVVVRGLLGCSFALITAYYGCYFLSWRFVDADPNEGA